MSSAAQPTSDISSKDQAKVVTASALGTLFEWYDFFIYGTLAALLAAKFFPTTNPTAGLLASLAAFGAGFGVRPLGAIVFGHLGDLVGRKYTFLITITIMGLATVLVGVLPTYESVGILAPILLVTLRLLQGLALGGEYGGAAIYVAEHAPQGKRGWLTSWIQLSAMGGLLLSLLVVLGCRVAVGEEAFQDWGWRLPFLLSILMLVMSIYIRTTLSESPVFQQMKSEGRSSKNPLKDSFGDWTNFKRILVALFGVASGLTVIWYTAQFATLIFLQSTAKLPGRDVYLIMVTALVMAAPLFVFFGWLSDKVGRKTLLVIGYILSLAFLMPMYQQLTQATNPGLFAAMEAAPVTISGDDCSYSVFAQEQKTACGQAMGYLTDRAISYSETPWTADVPGTRLTIGKEVLNSPQVEEIAAALDRAGYPLAAASEDVNHIKAILLIWLMTSLSALTFGPAAAILVELFPAKVRYTSMSIPYHVGAGYVGGFLPFIAQLLIINTGNIFAGMYYTLGVLTIALIVAVFFLPETKDRDILA